MFRAKPCAARRARVPSRDRGGLRADALASGVGALTLERHLADAQSAL